MAPQTRQQPAKWQAQPFSGLFRPALPQDSFAVMRLFAIAARTACVAPQNLDDIHAQLQLLSQRLVAPEVYVASECLKLWQLFWRVAQLPKASLRAEAARAFYHDLDTLGQRFEQPPLAEWDSLPDGLDEPQAIKVEEATLMSPIFLSLNSVKAQAQALRRQATPQNRLATAQQTAELLNQLASSARRQLFESMLQNGLLSRSEVNLLLRFLLKTAVPQAAATPGSTLGVNDNALLEVLERLGRHLAET